MDGCLEQSGDARWAALDDDERDLDHALALRVLSNPDLASKIELIGDPEAAPTAGSGCEHVMGGYVIWKFAKNKPMAKKFLVDLETKYIGAFENSKFYNFPSWPAAVHEHRPPRRA